MSAGRRAGIAVAVLLAAVVVLNLLAHGVDHAVGREPSGVAGSSFGTQASGLAGAAALLAHFGHPVSRQRGDLARTTLDPATTLFVVEPGTLTSGDDAELLDFVAAGGRLVIGGADPFYLHRLRDDPPAWSPDATDVYGDVQPALPGVRRVETAARGAWTAPGSGVALVGEGGLSLVVADRVGRGDLLFLADASPLENGYLTRADDAAFTVALAGATGRPVVFAEGTHGYGTARGLAAVPTPWKLALAVLAAAALVLAWARSRRFGPPDRPSRELTPARAEYVRALAVSLERAHEPAAALESLQGWARSRVAARARLAADATPEQVDRAAIALGFSEPERAALWYPPADDDAVLALGRLVSELSQHERSTT